MASSGHLAAQLARRDTLAATQFDPGDMILMTVANVPVRVRVRRRSRQDWVFAGVSGGLGRYAERDPLWFRVLFVVLACYGGLGILIYFGLWLAIPFEQPGDELGPPTFGMRARARREESRRKHGGGYSYRLGRFLRGLAVR